MKKILLKYKFIIILSLVVAVFAILFSQISIRRYLTLNSHYYDLGIMNQVVYNTSKNRFLEMTNQDLKANVSRLAIHFDPILVLFAPLYKIYPQPKILLVSQVIIVALGGLTVFLLTKKILKNNWLGMIFSLVYLVYFPIQRAVIFDFHAVTLATTFFLFAIYFQEIKKPAWFYFFIFLTLLTKEHVGLVAMFYGAFIYLVKKDKKQGLITALTGLIFFVATFYFIIPYFRGSEHFALRYFEDFGDSPSSILINFFRHPLVVIRTVFRPEVFDYVIRMILPLFYALFSPLSFLIALPEWAINILSTNENMRMIFFHYNSIIVPFIFYSLILGYKNFFSIVKNKVLRAIIFTVFILLNLRSIYLYNPVPSFVKNPIAYKDINPVKKKSIERLMVELKDDNIKVATTPKLAPFFTNRKYYYNFLYDPAFAAANLTEKDVISANIDNYKMADYVIINRSEIGDISSGNLPSKFYLELTGDKNFQMISSDNRDAKSIEVYKKI